MQDIVRLASQYGRYGYRRVSELLRREGWRVNHKRVERIWRAEGLKVPQRYRPRRRLWLNDGSCDRLRLRERDQVWSYGFLSARTSDGRPLRFLTVWTSMNRERLAVDVSRKVPFEGVPPRLTGLTGFRSALGGPGVDTIGMVGVKYHVTHCNPKP